jgi:hypothetical protein
MSAMNITFQANEDEKYSELSEEWFSSIDEELCYKVPSLEAFENLQKSSALNKLKHFKNFNDLPVDTLLTVGGGFWKNTSTGNRLVLEVLDWETPLAKEGWTKLGQNSPIQHVWAPSTYEKLFSGRDLDYDRKAYRFGTQDNSLSHDQIRFPHLLQFKGKNLRGTFVYHVLNFDDWRSCTEPNHWAVREEQAKNEMKKLKTDKRGMKRKTVCFEAPPALVTRITPNNTHNTPASVARITPNNTQNTSKWRPSSC